VERYFSASLIFAGLMALGSMAAQADPLFTNPGTHPLRYGDGFSLGSEFVVETANLEVTALGLYDTSGSGFFQSHDVGLWDVSAGNTEVASATVPAGTGASLVNGFRYVNLISSVSLVLGDQYILAAFYPVGETPGVNDQLLDHNGSGSNAATDPNFGSFVAAFTSTGLGSSLGHLSEPNGTASGTDYVGPNLLYTTASPEPGTWLGMATGLIVIGAVLRRRHTS